MQRSSAEAQVPRKRRGRKIGETLRDGAVKAVVGDIEAYQLGCDAREAPGECVVLQEEAGEVGEVADLGSDGACEVVGGEVEASQASQASQPGGKLPGEVVVLEVEAAERGEVGEVGGDLTGEAVGAEAEDAEACDESNCVGRDGTHKLYARKVKGLDEGT